MMAFDCNQFETPTPPTNYPDHLWPFVERVLEQHLATRDAPLSGGGISATEASARRCAMLSVRNVACPACKGKKGRQRGIVWEDCEQCRGSGEVTTQLPKVQLQTRPCQVCSGSGEYRRKMVWVRDCDGRKHPLPNTAFGHEVELASCVTCRRNGYVETCDASPMKPPAPAEGSMPDEASAGRHAKLSAVLRRLQEADSQSALVVEVAYGPIGVQTRRRATSDHYRELALWPLTKPGASLLRYARGTPARSPQAALARLMAAQDGNPSPLVMALAERCQRASWVLVARARGELFRADTDGTIGKAAKRMWEQAAL